MEGPRRTNKRIGESEGPNEKRNVLFKKPLSRLFCVFIKLLFPLLSLQKTSSLSYPPATPILLFNLCTLNRALTLLPILLLKNRNPHAYPPGTPVLLFLSRAPAFFYAVSPPSTDQIAPVTKEASGEAKKPMTEATSAAAAKRCSGYQRAISFIASSLLGAASSCLSKRGVRTSPGQTQLTRISYGATSNARDRVKATTAPLEAL